MSGRYHAVDDYGLILDEDVMGFLVSNDNSEADGSDKYYELYERGICEYIPNFIGETHELMDSGDVEWCMNNTYYDCEAIWYIPLSGYPTLLRDTYNSMEGIVEEFEYKIGQYLPLDFDFRGRIRHICGVRYG